jgi:two-component system, OmpR family, phosphate regulon sensor histidine kinase PhoR
MTMAMTQDERLTYLGEILVALAGTPVPSQQFQTLADHAPVVLPCDYLAICLIAPDGQGYLIHSLLGTAGGAVPNRLFRLDEGVPGRVMARNKLVCSDDLATLSDTCPDFEGILARLGLSALMVAPLRQGNQAMGALVFANAGTPYGESEQQIGRLLSAGLSASLETTRLYQMLSDERSTLAAVLSSTQDAVLVVNEDGVVLLANPAVKQMFGLDPVAITGRRLLTETDNDGLIALFENPQVGFVEMVLPDGTSTAQASLVPVTSDYGEPVGWAAVFRDITLFKELEQMKNDFVATVSHDLKNPISSIKLGTEIIGKIGELNPKQAEVNGRIARTADYMNDLVTELLDLGKIEAGLNFAAESVDLVPLIMQVVENQQPHITAKAQSVACDLPDSLMVVGDAGRLLQVLSNLIGNAVKYTPAEGQIMVSGRQNGTVEVSVRDTGIGIPARDLPYVFDKFYRVASAETKQIKGTGLGLAIVKSIVEAHNGRISVTSTPGQGSTFTVRLPTLLP